MKSAANRKKSFTRSSNSNHGSSSISSARDIDYGMEKEKEKEKEEKKESSNDNIIESSNNEANNAIEAATMIQGPDENSVQSYGLTVLMFRDNFRECVPFVKNTGDWLAPKDNRVRYQPLENIMGTSNKPDWRRRLGNDYPCNPPIFWRGYHYATVQHALNASYFFFGDEETHNWAKKFSLDSEDKQFCTAGQIKAAKGAASIKGKYKLMGEKLDRQRPKRINHYLAGRDALSADYEEKIKEFELEILVVKFSTDQLCKQVLLATGNALLVHGSESKPLAHKICLSLMDAREIIRADTIAEAQEKQSTMDANELEKIKEDLELEKSATSATITKIKFLGDDED